MRVRLFLLLMAVAAPAAVLAQVPHTTLTMGMVQFPPDLHPYITSTTIKETVLQAMNRPMIGFTAEGTPICLLCTRVPSLQNGDARLIKHADGSEGMEVDYTLKPGLTWGDGVPVTARDIVFSYHVSLQFNPSQTIETAVALDEHTVRFTLKTPVFDYWRTPNSFTTSAMLSEHIEGPIFAAAKSPLEYGQNSAFNRHPEEPGLWLGPYRMGKYDRGGEIILVPNEHWHGTQPHFQKIVLRLIENTAALQANLLSGDVDVTGSGNLGLTLDQVLSLAKTQADRFDFDFVPSTTAYENLTLNVDDPLLADRRVRQAMSMAIDRKAIVATLFANRYEVADSFLHPTMFGWDKSTQTWPFNPDAARKKLAEAGFRPGADGVLVSPAGQRFSIDFITTAGNHIRELTQQIIQRELKSVGIEAVVRNQPAREMFGQTLRERHFHGMVMFDSGFQLGDLPTTTFSSSYIPSAANAYSGKNYSGWRNPLADQAMADARSELDDARRRAQWKIILDQYAEDMPTIPLFYAGTGVVSPKWLAGFDNPGRFGTETTAWIEEWRPK